MKMEGTLRERLSMGEFFKFMLEQVESWSKLNPVFVHERLNLTVQNGRSLDAVALLGSRSAFVSTS